MNPNSETGFWDWPRTRSRRAIGTLLPGFSGESFETLAASDLGPSDLVPKPAGCETNHRKTRLAIRQPDVQRNAVFGSEGTRDMTLPG